MQPPLKSLRLSLYCDVEVSYGDALHVGSKSCLYELTELNSVGPEH